MTLDALIAEADAKLEAVLARRLEELAFELMASIDPEADGPPPDDSGRWRPVTFDEMIELQRDADRRWKAETLAGLRPVFAKAFGLEP